MTDSITAERRKVSKSIESSKMADDKKDVGKSKKQPTCGTKRKRSKISSRFVPFRTLTLSRLAPLPSTLRQMFHFYHESDLLILVVGYGPVNVPFQAPKPPWTEDDHKNVDWAEVLQPMSTMTIAEEEGEGGKVDESDWEYSIACSSLLPTTESDRTRDEPRPLITATRDEIMDVLAKAREMVPELPLKNGPGSGTVFSETSHQIPGMAFHQYYLNPQSNPQLRGVATELLGPAEQHEGHPAFGAIAPLYTQRPEQKREGDHETEEETPWE